MTFLCGGRARADYARLRRWRGPGRALHRGQDEMLDLLDRRAAEAEALRKDLPSWRGSGSSPRPPRCGPPRRRVRATGCAWSSPALDVPSERAKRVAQALRSQPATVACSACARRAAAVALRPAPTTCRLDAGALLRAAAPRAAAAGAAGPMGPGRRARRMRRLTTALEAARAASRGRASRGA